MKRFFSATLGALLIACTAQAINFGIGPVYKKTNGANKDDITEDLNIPIGRTLKIRGTLDATGATIEGITGGGSADGKVIFGTGVPAGGTGNVGDTYQRLDSPFSTYLKTGASTWTVEISFVPQTLTVNGHPLSGNVTVTASDVGLGSVNNTADSAKPVSTAQQTALDAKVDKTTTVNGHALSGNVTVTAADVAALFNSRTAKTSAYTVLAADKGVCFDSTSGTFTYTLTAAATLGSGWQCAFVNSGSGTVTIDPNGSETVRDAASSAATKTLIQGESGILLCDGTGFFLIKTSAPGSGTDSNAFHGNVSAEFTALTAKASPVSADTLAIEDSAASNAKKKVALSALPVSTATQAAIDAKAAAMSVGALGSNALALTAKEWPVKTATWSTNQTLTFTGGTSTAGFGEVIVANVTTAMALTVTPTSSTVYRNGSNSALGASTIPVPIGTWTFRFWTPDNGTTLYLDDTVLTPTDLGTLHLPVEFCIPCSDETTAITTGIAKRTFRAPYAFTITAVRASVTTAPTGSTILIDVNESGTTILSTKLMIDASEKTSQTAATPYVISDSAIADDAEISIDFDQVGSSVHGAGVKVWILGYR